MKDELQVPKCCEFDADTLEETDRQHVFRRHGHIVLAVDRDDVKLLGRDPN